MTQAGRRALLWALMAPVLALALVPVTPGARASDETVRSIAVLYPDIGEPYRSVFTTIIQGIEDKTKGRVAAFAVGANPNVQEIAGELRRRDVRAVIALGRNGLKLAAALERPLGIVAGGVVSVPESEADGAAVYSLAPDPGLLFTRLKALVPAARKVTVIYDPKQNTWLIRLAREAAKAQGLELVALEASDLKTATRLYAEMLAGCDPKRDALWLPQDSTTVEDSAVLPLVLREAWNLNLPVFSSSIGHVKRGALFALYPNNMELGRSLANSAQIYLSSGALPSRGMLPLRDVLTAANTRTANHLGINLGETQLRIHAVFPEP